MNTETELDTRHSEADADPSTAATGEAYTHWRMASDIDGVCWLTLDREGEKVNSLSRSVLEELDQILSELEAAPPRGLIIQSGKPESFIVGADIREFDEVRNPEEATRFIREAHDLFNRLEALSCAKTALIEGFCLGGGLELALACDYRIALDVDHTRLGFPEVQLGIYPAFGGSARSTLLIGGKNAMPLMLSGRMVSARQARGLGLVDELVNRHKSLRWAGRKAVLANRKSRRRGPLSRLTDVRPVRRMLAGVMRKKTTQKANPIHYPAPFELIDAWEEYGNDKHGMLNEEAERVGRLITGDTSIALRRVFRLMERLKAQGKTSGFKARRVHVIGAGVMGGDIAAWCTLQGLEVTLQDRELKYIEPALKRAYSLFRKKLKTPEKIAGAKSRLIADVDGKGIPMADVIIEAIFENVDAKRQLFEKIEARAKPDALIATNTSAIPLSDLSGIFQSPERLIGLHFFNPVARMPLVEVVHDKVSNPADIERGSAFCRQINRFPLPVLSSPGFLVNRVLTPYMLKAMKIQRERNIPIEALDKAATEFGMPMGPVELADTVGLDVCLSVMTLLGGDDSSTDAELVKSHVDKGWLGKKSGRGFYSWKKCKPLGNADAVKGINLKSLGDELMESYFEECRQCLADGVVADSDLIDAGMIFGTGFAPFRGGPMYYLDSRDGDASNSSASGSQVSFND
jgi:3-hydroxyacyl-CoA dehydrogenase/enoyl-CoA hydratase/3-hydroxybutyryl-CoA epimerase